VMSTEDVTWGLTAIDEGARMPGAAKKALKSITVHARASLLREMMTEAIQTRSVVSRVLTPSYVRATDNHSFSGRGAERSLSTRERSALFVVTSSSASR
jgi:hypothetical protein